MAIVGRDLDLLSLQTGGDMSAPLACTQIGDQVMATWSPAPVLERRCCRMQSAMRHSMVRTAPMNPVTGQLPKELRAPSGVFSCGTACKRMRLLLWPWSGGAGKSCGPARWNIFAPSAKA